MPWLPGILFGSLSIAVGLLALLLPETLNRPLPQTVEDIESWKRKPPAASAAAAVMTSPVTAHDVPADDEKHALSETLELTSNDVKT